MNAIVETRLALFSRVSPSRLEVRLKPRLVIDVAGVAELMAERKRMCGDTPISILVLVPQDIQPDAALVGVDHYAVNDALRYVQAVALVVEGLMPDTLARLHLAYYPPRFPLRVFASETEARTWLDQQVTELHRTTE